VLVPSVSPDPVLSGSFDVGGRALYLECTGSGPPTIVLDAGGGLGSSTWLPVTPSIAGSARVCTYDRANIERSDPAPKPRCLADAVSDLHALLAIAEVAPPYVLVGHSIGGLDIRLFGATYPDEVSGLVFIDATPVAYLKEFAADSCGEPMDPIPGEGYNYEGIHAATTDLDAIERYVPDVPARILVAGGHPEQLDEGERLDEEWIVLHRELAQSWPAAELIVVEGSGHFIHQERPEVVVAAVQSLLEDIGPGTSVD
jgi:pimeloyl-ACP methyl ester carboxylesterase